MSTAYQPLTDPLVPGQHAISIPEGQQPSAPQQPAAYAQQPQQQQPMYGQQQPQQQQMGFGQPQQLPLDAYGQPQAAAVIPIAYSYPLGQQLLLSMPSSISGAFKAMWAGVFSLWIGLMIFEIILFQELDVSGGFWLWWYFPFLIVVFALIIIFKTPTRLEVSNLGVTVFTRGTSYSLSYSRMTSIEVLRSTVCWTGAACTYPRTRFTSFENSIFFRSQDCATSLGFSPEDLNTLLMALQRTEANGKIFYS